MEPKYPSILQYDCDIMGRNLDLCLACFDKTERHLLTASELQFKSMLLALRGEVAERSNELASRSPFPSANPLSSFDGALTEPA